MEPIPFSVVLKDRNRAYNRTPDRRVRTPADARRFVRRVGFCLFWPTKGIEAPTLLHAIAGRAIPLGAGYKHPSFGRSWNWKDEALDKRWWYYGRLLRGRATLVSLQMLPAFYALSENYGDPDDYLLQYQDGRLSADAKSVYEALLESGPLDTVRLRKEARLAADTGKARFQKALIELQEGLKIMPVGVAEAGAWDYAFVYDLVTRWLPTLEQEARQLSTSEARRRIVLQHLNNVVAISEEDVRRLVGWPAASLRRVVEALVEEAQVERIPVATTGGSVSMLAGRAWARRVHRARTPKRGPLASRGRARAGRGSSPRRA